MVGQILVVRKWTPSMLVDDLETVLHTYPPLWRRVRNIEVQLEFSVRRTIVQIDEQQRQKLRQPRRLAEVVTTSFPGLELPILGKLVVHLHANNSSLEDLEVLIPIFHSNVSHKEPFEVGYK